MRKDGADKCAPIQLLHSDQTMLLRGSIDEATIYHIDQHAHIGVQHLDHIVPKLHICLSATAIELEGIETESPECLHVSLVELAISNLVIGADTVVACASI